MKVVAEKSWGVRARVERAAPQTTRIKSLESDSFYNASDTVSISGQVDRTKEVDGVVEVEEVNV